MEFDAVCAEKWASKNPRITITAGDQADIKTLEDFKSKYGKDFDVIIDDGGHTMVQQRTSLYHLWDAVKPGGIYVLEDLSTSYLPNYGGTLNFNARWEIKGRNGSGNDQGFPR